MESIFNCRIQVLCLVVIFDSEQKFDVSYSWSCKQLRLSATAASFGALCTNCYIHMVTRPCFHSVLHRLLHQRPQQNQRYTSSTTSVSYECCGMLHSPEEKVWSNNGNYLWQPALATHDIQDLIQAVSAHIQESKWLCSELSVGTCCATLRQWVSAAPNVDCVCWRNATVLPLHIVLEMCLEQYLYCI